MLESHDTSVHDQAVMQEIFASEQSVYLHFSCETSMNGNSLVGTYDLVSWEYRHKSGEISYPLGTDAKGVISYSSDGFVFVHVMANNRSNHAEDDVFGGGINEIKDSATTHISYCGSYVIEESEVIHCISVSSFPNLVPSEQRRNWEFKNGMLLLSAHGIRSGHEKVDAFLIWQRVTTQVLS